MKKTNNIYTLITRVFKKQVQPVGGRCYKNDATHFTSKNGEKETSTIQKSYVTVAASSFHEMPEDPVNSFLQKLRFWFSSGWGTRLHEYVDQRHKELGPIFKTNNGLFKMIFINSVDAYREIFLQHEGRQPTHFIPEAWIIYNNEHSKNNRGLFFMDGDEWYHFRKIMNKLILAPKSTNFMIEPCGHVAEDLAKKMSSYAEAGTVVPNLKQHIYEYSLEAILSSLMGSTWSTHKTQILRETDDLASVLYKIFKYSSRMSVVISARKAKDWNLPKWNQFVENLDLIMKKVTNTVSLMTSLKGDGLIQKMLDAGIEEKDIVRIVADLIIAAGDTTTSATQWALYSLSTHSEIQEQLYESIRDKKHEEVLAVPFVSWILKETLRMYPTAIFLTRYLPKDTYIGGYHVSKNDLLLLSLYSSGRDPANFINPDQFQPDRWSRPNGSNYKGVTHSTASIPFAVGVRSCVGKRMAEIIINLALAELVKNFKIECTNKHPLKIFLQMIAEPSKPIQLKLTPR